MHSGSCSNRHRMTSLIIWFIGLKGDKPNAPNSLPIGNKICQDGGSKKAFTRKLDLQLSKLGGLKNLCSSLRHLHVVQSYQLVLPRIYITFTKFNL